MIAEPALVCQASLAILRKRFVQSWPSDRRTFSLPPPNAKAEIGLPEHDTMRSAGIISAMPANEHILNVQFSKTLAERGSQGRPLTGSEGKI